MTKLGLDPRDIKSLDAVLSELAPAGLAAMGVSLVLVPGSDYESASRWNLLATTLPSLVEAVTYRWRGHSKSDRQAYRTRDEVKAWQARDPIPRFARLLGINNEDLERIRVDSSRRIEEAVALAETSPEPDPSRMLEGVYA